ncbi:MAG TPA: AraC family transcriptional regulator [Pyrinomonadaceae bacterium]|nr:AraC family transcriptional regulator [Pyrinomonadaceae bacterium]
MDVLSEMLRSVKLEGALFFNGEFSAPWCLNTKPDAIASYCSPKPGHLIVYHFLTEGRAYVKLGDGRREELSAGDIVICPHGDEHLLGNGSTEPLDSLKTFAEQLSQGLKLVKFGGGGEITKFVCGFLTCDPRLGHVFLSGLPSIVTVKVINDRSDQWLERSIRFSVDDANRANAGAELVRAKLAELLFIETLRRYINELPTGEVGWLAGARDSTVGHALALLHNDPKHAWTISELAREVGLSRSRLAERFRHFLGDPPMAYLAQWRLKLGAEILESSDDSIAEVAAAVGYGSEASFNRAFKREFNSPPAQFRRQRRNH